MGPGSVWRRVGYFVLLASLWPGVGLAQTTVLEGRVTDPLGGTVNGALVTLNSPGTTAAASLVIWLAAITAGRFMAYV